jgi:hypothetical protein
MLVPKSGGSLLLMMLAMVIDPISAIARNGWHLNLQYSMAAPAAYARHLPQI